MGWFILLAMVNKASINMGFEYFYGRVWSLGLGPGVKELGHMVVLF